MKNKVVSIFCQRFNDKKSILPQIVNKSEVVSTVKVICSFKVCLKTCNKIIVYIFIFQSIMNHLSIQYFVIEYFKNAFLTIDRKLHNFMCSFVRAQSKLVRLKQVHIFRVFDKGCAAELLCTMHGLL
jgi:hypothetical protein